MLEDSIILIDKIRDFFKEFDFSGITSIRFFNTLMLQAKKGNSQRYILNYFKLIDSPYVEEVRLKLTSKEFLVIAKELQKVPAKIDPINKRFELFYGNQGGGKTTKAIAENPDAEIMICKSSFEPSDLLETFEFYDGKPIYKPSILQNAMTGGRKIILDEINLLTRDCLRTLQGYLDNKTSVDFKGKRIEIKEGFKIIGTMNLEVNGQVEALPAPLVDRASNLVEIEPTSEFLAKLAFGE